MKKSLPAVAKPVGALTAEAAESSARNGTSWFNPAEPNPSSANQPSEETLARTLALMQQLDAENMRAKAFLAAAESLFTLLRTLHAELVNQREIELTPEEFARRFHLLIGPGFRKHASADSAPVKLRSYADFSSN